MRRDHRKLKAFELANDLVIQVYDATRTFPKEEPFGPTSQIRRAAVSAPANIVEGCGRRSTRDFLRFRDLAHGSLRELGYLMGLARRLGYLTQSRADALVALYEQASRVLAGLGRSLRAAPPDAT